MKGNDEVIQVLQDALSAELTAINQFNGSRALLEEILKSEEEHIDWLEAQLHQIKEIGYERYLSQQTGDK